MNEITGLLIPGSRHYKKWRAILDDNHVPIKSLLPVRAMMGAPGTYDVAEVYALDLDRFTAQQRTRLIQFIVDFFGCTNAEAEEQLNSIGFPIRVEDCSVAIPGRFF